MAVVVHSGSGPNRGHYVTLVKSHGLWFLFDDELVEVSFIFQFFNAITSFKRLFYLSN